MVLEVLITATEQEKVTKDINAIIDNSDIYSFVPWISMDKDLFIKIEENNHNDLVKYIFNRFKC